MRTVLLLLLCALCTFVGYALATAFGLAFPGPSAGDWLTATSGAIGVVVTIAGAVWIEEYRRRSAERHGIKRFIEVLTDLVQMAHSVRKNIPEWSDDDRTHVNSTYSQKCLLREIRKYRFVRETVQVTDVDLWDALSDVDRELDTGEPLIERELNLLEANPKSKEVYAINREKVSEAARRIAHFGGMTRVVASDLLSLFPTLRR